MAVGSFHGFQLDPNQPDPKWLVHRTVDTMEMSDYGAAQMVLVSCSVGQTWCQDRALSEANVGMIQLWLMVKVFNIHLHQGRSLRYSHRVWPGLVVPGGVVPGGVVPGLVVPGGVILCMYTVLSVCVFTALFYYVCCPYGFIWVIS